MITELENALVKNRSNFHPVVDFDPATEKLFQFDFTDANTGLSKETIADTNLFSDYVNQQLKNNDAKYGIGGYKENRKLYRRS
ncbi:MAG: peptidase M23, partial [Ferruginibacter sp.]